MKATVIQTARASGNRPTLPSALPPTHARPVRRGGLWPGEGFVSCTRKLDLADTLAEYGFTLPVLTGGRGPRTL